MSVFRESDRKLPKPSVEAAQRRQRLPRTLYSKLTRQAEREGVSINSLVTAIIAEANRDEAGESAEKRMSRSVREIDAARVRRHPQSFEEGRSLALLLQ
jgi:hypothetical protein